MGTLVCVSFAALHFNSDQLQLNSETVSFLLSKGADTTVSDMSSNTALILASMKGHTEIVQALLTHWSALGKGTLPSRNQLLVQGRGSRNIETDLKRLVERKDQDKRTALWWAACNGHKDIVLLLMDSRASLRVKDADQRTPGSLRTTSSKAHTLRSCVCRGCCTRRRTRGFGAVVLWGKRQATKTQAKRRN